MACIVYDARCIDAGFMRAFEYRENMHLDGFLDDAAAVHLEGQCLDVALDQGGHELLLVIVAEVQELLHHVVAKHVVHQLQRRVLVHAHLGEGGRHLHAQHPFRMIIGQCNMCAL